MPNIDLFVLKDYMNYQGLNIKKINRISIHKENYVHVHVTDIYGQDELYDISIENMNWFSRDQKIESILNG